MKCPYCDSIMETMCDMYGHPTGYVCTTPGPLLRANDTCPYYGDVLSEDEILAIEVALIDIDH